MRTSLRTRLTWTQIGFVLASGLATAAIAAILLTQTAYRTPPTDVFQAAKDQAARDARTNPHAPLDIDARVVAQVRRETMVSLGLASGAALALVTVAATGVSWWSSGRTLRSLRAIAQTAQQAAGGQLEERIALAGPHDEVKLLADTFDAMLARLQQAFDQQRRFSAHVSHELRTPLAITRTALDLTMDKPDPTRADLTRMTTEITSAVDRAESIIAGLLTLARAERGLDRTEPVDLSAVVRDGLARAVDHEDLVITQDLQPAEVLGDRTLLVQLVTNLLDNAIHHNRPKGSIHIDVRHDADGARLTVINTFATAPGQLDRLTEPFVRGTHTHDRRGAGLGLAIAAAIVTAHRGDLTITITNDQRLATSVRLTPVS